MTDRMCQPGQASGSLASYHLDKDRDKLRVEMLASVILQERDELFFGARRVIGSLCGQRIIHVGQGQQAALDRDVLVR